MPRTSLNPNKEGVLVRKPYISMGIVTHYTNDSYHKDRMEVVETCLNSITHANQVPDELIIWDNGSTPRFREMLASFMPDILIESYNVGLDNAKHALVEMARGDVFCYSDDDILYSPDWMQKHLELLETFPNVGTVSGSPQRVNFRWGIETNKKFPHAEWLDVIPDEWERDYCDSVGKDWNKHKNVIYYERDLVLSYSGIKAFGHGHHMQFMARRDIIKPFLHQSEYAMNEHKSFDCAVDKAGYLRLTTYERTARHLGNKLD